MDLNKRPIFSFKHRYTPDITQDWIEDTSFVKFWEVFVNELSYNWGVGLYSDACDVLKVDLKHDLYVRHHFYRTACAPYSAEFDDIQEFFEELHSACVGDVFQIWTLSDSPQYFIFTCPNNNNNIPN